MADFIALIASVPAEWWFTTWLALLTVIFVVLSLLIGRRVRRARRIMLQALSQSRAATATLERDLERYVVTLERDLERYVGGTD